MAALERIASGPFHTCGLDPEGGAVCWGAATPALGTDRLDGCTGGACTVPVRVDGNRPFVDIALGAGHTCVLGDDGRAYCWGFSSAGAIGNWEITPEWPSPQPVCGGHLYVDITAGRHHSCAVSTLGRGWCWGANDSFQLGGTFFSSLGPRAVSPVRPG